MNERNAPARATPWRLALTLSALFCACSDPAAPADAAVDQAPPVDADVTDVTVDSDDAADASDAFVDAGPLPRCEWPDGGASASTIEMGRIRAVSLCNFCHQDSTPGAGDFSGQLMARPRTMSYGANLTPDRDTGIGGRTDEQLLRSIRYGTSADGARRLCEMAPFDSARLNDAGLCALLAYLRALPPVRRMVPASTCAAR